LLSINIKECIKELNDGQLFLEAEVWVFIKKKSVFRIENEKMQKILLDT
jgi:hypothetical protein